MKRPLMLAALTLTGLAATAAAPASIPFGTQNSCAATLTIGSAQACGNGGDQHAGESCIWMTQPGYPSWYCWSSGLGWHWH